MINSFGDYFFKKVAKYLDRTRMFLVLFYKMNVETWEGVKDMFMQSEQFIVKDVSFTRKDVFGVRLVIRNVIN